MSAGPEINSGLIDCSLSPYADRSWRHLDLELNY
jgi:hypothetical protein